MQGTRGCNDILVISLFPVHQAITSYVEVSLVGKPGNLPSLCHLVQSNAHYTECKCEYSATLSTVERVQYPCNGHYLTLLSCH